MPECQKIRKDGLDQYGAERFGRLIFATVEKCGTEMVKLRPSECLYVLCAA